MSSHPPSPPLPPPLALTHIRTHLPTHPDVKRYLEETEDVVETSSVCRIQTFAKLTGILRPEKYSKQTANIVSDILRMLFDAKSIKEWFEDVHACVPVSAAWEVLSTSFLADEGKFYEDIKKHEKMMRAKAGCSEGSHDMGLRSQSAKSMQAPADLVKIPIGIGVGTAGDTSGGDESKRPESRDRSTREGEHDVKELGNTVGMFKRESSRLLLGKKISGKIRKAIFDRIQEMDVTHQLVLPHQLVELHNELMAAAVDPPTGIYDFCGLTCMNQEKVISIDVMLEIAVTYHRRIMVEQFGVLKKIYRAFDFDRDGLELPEFTILVKQCLLHYPSEEKIASYYWKVGGEFVRGVGWWRVCSRSYGGLLAPRC